MRSVTPVLGMSDTTRPILLIGFVVLLFGIAGLAVVLGKRRVEAQQAKALSADTGVDKGAMQGADQTHSSDWLTATRSEIDETPKHSWADAILGPGALHDDHRGGEVVAPEIALQQDAAAATHAAEEQSTWGAAPTQDASGWDTLSAPAATAEEPQYPAYLQPEDLGSAGGFYAPAYEPPVQPAVAPVSDSDEVVAPPMPWLAPEATDSTPTGGGKRRAAVPVDAPSNAAPFLVEDYLGDED